MGTIEEGFCVDDSDCSEKQYCYEVSQQCVNYTLCSRYNRLENKKPAQNPRQCGPCLPGYTAEELGTGELAHLCKKITPPETVPGSDRFNNTWIIFGSFVSVAIFIVMIILCAIFWRKRNRKRQNNNSEHCGDLETIQPSAPPESSPFISRKKGLLHMPFNKILKDKNRLVHASVFKPPYYVTRDPNYENNLNNNHDGMNALQLHSTFRRSSINDNSNPLAPAQLTQGDVTEYGIEQIENSSNAALVQRNDTTSNASGDDTANNNSNNNDNGSGNASASESNTRDGQERARSSNILIAQINVNVHNCDY
ncbi:uncharacterized protein LOC144472801 [Augochlora pura]